LAGNLVTIGEVAMQVIRKEVFLEKLNLNDRLEVLEEGLTGAPSGSLPKSGGEMTGPLILHSDPTQPLEAATKQYVDTNITTVATNKISKFGDVMYGELVLAGDAVHDFNPVTKRQLETATENTVQTGLLDW
jgi:hypothetical protein